jgi:hypothetical protein
MKTMKLAEAINLRLRYGSERAAIEPLLDIAHLFEDEHDRRSVNDELDEITASGPKVPLEKVQSRNNKLRENIRILDSAIQQANFTNKVNVKAFAMKDYVENYDERSEVEVLISDILSRRKTTLVDLNGKQYFERSTFRWEAEERVEKAAGLEQALDKKVTVELDTLTTEWRYMIDSYIELNNALQKANWNVEIKADINI